MTTKTNDQLVREAIAMFPRYFGLRAFPGRRFALSATSSYVDDSGVIQLYTEVENVSGWSSFAKGTVAELCRNIVNVDGTPIVRDRKVTYRVEVLVYEIVTVGDSEDATDVPYEETLAEFDTREEAVQYARGVN